MDDDNLGIVWVIAVILNVGAWVHGFNTGSEISLFLAFMGTVTLMPLTFLVGVIALAEWSVQRNY